MSTVTNITSTMITVYKNSTLYMATSYTHLLTQRPGIS